MTYPIPRGRAYSSGNPGMNPAKRRPPVKTTSIALERVQSFIINQYEAIDGGTPYELIVNGESVMFGIGETSDAFLDAAIFLDEGQPDTAHD